MILACHVVGDEVDDDIEACAVGAVHQRRELLHASRNARGQVRVDVKIVLDGIDGAGLAFDDGAMVAANAEGGVVCLRGMLDDARVPDMGGSQRLDLCQRFGREVCHGAAAIDGAVAIGLVDTPVIAEEAREDLIDDGFVDHGVA